MEKATFWDRAAAWSIDFGLFQVLSVIAAAVFSIPHSLGWSLLWATLWLFIYIVYNIIMEGVFGATLGKHLLGLVVKDPSGTLSWGKVFVRQLGCAVSWITLNLGHAMAIVRPDKKMLQDILTNTEVVKGESRWPFFVPRHVQEALKISALVLMVFFSLFVTYRLTVEIANKMEALQQAGVGI